MASAWPDRLDGATVLELGAGTGLVGLLAARRAAAVLLTDVGDDVLSNCAANVASCANARVRRLDWTTPPPWTVGAESPANAFAWKAADLACLRHASVALVADCVYDDELTDALWATLEALFAHCPSLHVFVSIERRINFAAADLTGAWRRCAASSPHTLSDASALQRVRTPLTISAPSSAPPRTRSLSTKPRRCLGAASTPKTCHSVWRMSACQS